MESRTWYRRAYKLRREFKKLEETYTDILYALRKGHKVSLGAIHQLVDDTLRLGARFDKACSGGASLSHKRVAGLQQRLEVYSESLRKLMERDGFDLPSYRRPKKSELQVLVEKLEAGQEGKG